MTRENEKVPLCNKQLSCSRESSGCVIKTMRIEQLKWNLLDKALSNFRYFFVCISYLNSTIQLLLPIS